MTTDQQQSVDTVEVYFTLKANLRSFFQQREVDSRVNEPDPEYVTGTSAPTISHLPHAVYYYNNDSEDEYVLPPQNRENIAYQSNVTPRSTKQRAVADLYDEDHYALPDVDGCITEKFGVLKTPISKEQPEVLSKGKGSELSENKMKIMGAIVGLLVIGGIIGVVVTVFRGIICLLTVGK